MLTPPSSLLQHSLPERVQQVVRLVVDAAEAQGLGLLVPALRRVAHHHLQVHLAAGGREGGGGRRAKQEVISKRPLGAISGEAPQQVEDLGSEGGGGK